MNTNLERAAELVAQALKLVDEYQYHDIAETLQAAWLEIDNQIDAEDERTAWAEDK